MPFLSVTACTRLFPTIGDRFGIEEDSDAARFDGLFQQTGSVTIELALHEPIHQVHDRDLRACLGQSVRRFEPQQTTADHNNARVPLRGRLDRGDVGQIAECHDTGLSPRPERPT